MRPITERLSPVIKTLVIVNALLFTFYAVVRQAQPFFQEHLALGPGIFAGRVWQPVTSLFVHLDFLNFAFSVIGIWFIGTTIERAVGTKRFLLLFFASGVLANLATAALAAQVGAAEIYAGCGSAVLALFVAFGTLYNRTPARILGGLVMSARTLTAILVGFALLVDLSRGDWPRLAADLVALVLGYALVGGRGHGLRELWTDWRARRQRRRYQILEGGRKASKPARPPYLN